MVLANTGQFCGKDVARDGPWQGGEARWPIAATYHQLAGIAALCIQRPVFSRQDFGRCWKIEQI